MTKMKTCTRCTTECNSNEFIYCTTCLSNTHICEKRMKECNIDANILTSVISAGFKYYCENCIDDVKAMTSSIVKLMCMIDNLTKKMSSVENELKQLKGKTNTCVTSSACLESFASVIRKENEKKNELETMNDDSVIIITPENNCLNKKESREKNQKEINPVNPVNSLNKISSNHSGSKKKIVAKSKSTNHKELINEAKTKLGEDFNVKLHDTKKPRLKLVRFINDDYTNDDIMAALKSQNGSLLNDDDKIKIVKLYKKQKSAYTTIVIETEPRIHELLIKKGVVNIKWSNCKVYDSIEINRCYKCCRYSHQAKDCKSESDICPKCSGPHKLIECKANNDKCINCLDAVRKYGLNIDINHNALSKNCPSTMRRIEHVKKTVSNK